MVHTLCPAPNLVRRNNSQIVRMLNELSLGATADGAAVDLCPASLKKEIDAMNEFVYEKVREHDASSNLYCFRSGSDEKAMTTGARYKSQLAQELTV